MSKNSRRSVLVTGCSSGIGYVAARELLARGYRVFAAARRPADVERLEAEGLESLLLDLDRPDTIHRAIAETLEKTGGELHGLVNNAAFAIPGAIEDLDRDALRAQFETNVFGTLELTQQVIPAMRRQGHGRIVMISSILGLVAMPWRGAYNASKFALEGFTDTLRLELAGSGIRVSTINPGAIESRFRKNAVAVAESRIDLDASRHRAHYTRMKQFAADNEGRMPGSAPPGAVVRPIVHALEATRPRIRYYVTPGARLLAVLRRLLPPVLLDRLLLKL